jgi:peptidoglycan/xylan/chitin deacetylase (PgdA/CDA1 family)
MGWLQSKQFECVTPAEWLSGLAPARSVCLTFDDGYEDFYFEVFPHVESWRLKPTVFVVLNRIGAFSTWEVSAETRPRKLLSKTQISEMQRYGVQFGSHSLTHPWLPNVSDAKLHREVAESKSRLEDLLGTEVSCFAYPSGGLDSRVRSAVAAAGYKIAVTTRPGLSFWQDPLCLNRCEVTEVDGLSDFILRVKTGRSQVREIYYNLFLLTHATAMQLPDPIAKAIRKLARSLRITFPWRSC